MRRIFDWLHRHDWTLAGRWFLLSGIVGVAAGFGAAFFFWASEGLFEFAIGDLAGYWPRAAGGEGGGPGRDEIRVDDLVPWMLVLIPAIGGLVSGWIVFRFAPEAEGHGTDAALRAYHQRKGIIHWRVPLVKTVASILTLGSGGSGGREGPIAQIGAGFGSFLAFKLGLGARDRRLLLAAGMGAGVAAIFRAPLAGALFAAEIHYRDSDFESEAIIPSGLASIVSYCIYSSFFGYHELFTTPQFKFDDPRELLAYTVLALAVAAAAFLFIKVFYGGRDLFRKVPVPDWLKPGIGGAAMGLVALGLYSLAGDSEALSVLGFGYGTLQGALDERVGIGLLLLVAIGKMVTTALTIGSGGSSGVFGPSMVIGGAIGGAVGLAMNAFFPEVVVHPGSYVLVGMAGFFAGAAHTPISTIIMVSEMTGNYSLLLPAMWVTLLVFVLLRKYSIYEHQLVSIRHSPAHYGDFFSDVLAGMRVTDVPRSPGTLLTFPESATLGEILHLVDHTHQNYFPVVDEDGQMVRIFSLNDIRPYFYEEQHWEDLRARDLGTDDIVKVETSDSLWRAIRRLTERNIDAIPVVDEERPGTVVGLLRRKELIDAYNRKLRHLTADS